jgi:hypothetical protein
MANNPYVNKVVYGNDTLLDLTGDTVTAGDMLSGVTAHDRSGAPITGNLEPVLGVEVNGTTYTPDSNGVVDIGTVASGSSALSLTLASGSWSSATPPTQTITATGVTASNNIIVGIGSGITSAQYDAACAAKLVCTAQGANSITMTAYGTKPTENIPISVVILG